jgi:hypothetical protein
MFEEKERRSRPAEYTENMRQCNVPKLSAEISNRTENAMK